MWKSTLLGGLLCPRDWIQLCTLGIQGQIRSKWLWGLKSPRDCGSKKNANKWNKVAHLPVFPTFKVHPKCFSFIDSQSSHLHQVGTGDPHSLWATCLGSRLLTEMYLKPREGQYSLYCSLAAGQAFAAMRVRRGVKPSSRHAPSQGQAKPLLAVLTSCFNFHAVNRCLFVCMRHS